MRRNLAESIVQTETDRPDIRPLPPMTEEEAKGMMLEFISTAETRVLTTDEAFLFGQLVSVFRMAVRATTLGRKGRYFVMSEDDIKRAAALGEM